MLLLLLLRPTALLHRITAHPGEIARAGASVTRRKRLLLLLWRRHPWWLLLLLLRRHHAMRRLRLWWRLLCRWRLCGRRREHIRRERIGRTHAERHRRVDNTRLRWRRPTCKRIAERSRKAA